MCSISTSDIYILDPISLENLLDHIPIPDIAMLSRTNRFWQHLCRDYTRRKLRILLQKYFDDANSFRDLMRTTETILTGSEAINFALHGQSLPHIFTHDLDIYVGSVHALQVVTHLRDVQGYDICPIAPYPNDFRIKDSRVGRLTHIFLVHRRRRMMIRVTCSSRTTPLFSLVQSWSTLHITFLTADMLVIAYPTLTFAGEGLLCYIHRHGDRTNDAALSIQTYRARGFTIEMFHRNRVRVRDRNNRLSAKSLSTDR